MRLLRCNVGAKNRLPVGRKGDCARVCFIVDEGLYHKLCEAIDLMWIGPVDS